MLTEIGLRTRAVAVATQRNMSSAAEEGSGEEMRLSSDDDASRKRSHETTEDDSSENGDEAGSTSDVNTTDKTWARATPSRRSAGSILCDPVMVGTIRTYVRTAFSKKHV